MGETLRSRPPNACAGAPRRFGTFARAGHTRQAAETLRTLSGAAQRPPVGTSQTLPGPQEGCLSPRREQARSFAMYLKLIAKLLLVKTQEPVEKVGMELTATTNRA